MLPSIFMLIPLGAFAEYEKEELEQIGIIYEYISEAGPWAVNGYPSFFSLRVMHKEDWERSKTAIKKELERRESIEV